MQPMLESSSSFTLVTILGFSIQHTHSSLVGITIQCPQVHLQIASLNELILCQEHCTYHDVSISLSDSLSDSEPSEPEWSSVPESLLRGSKL